MKNGEQQGGPATAYRLFVLGDQGRVTSVPLVITARDDKAASREAEGLCAGKAAELWHGARLIARFACKVTGQFAQQDMGGLLAFS